MTKNDPAAAARGIAERLIDMMAREVDAFVITTYNAEKQRSHDPKRTRQRIDDARQELARSAVTGVEGVDVRTDFVDLRTAQDAEARISNHVAEACIRMNGPNRIRIHCIREDERFRVTARQRPRVRTDRRGGARPRNSKPRPTSTPTQSSTPSASETRRTAARTALRRRNCTAQGSPATRTPSRGKT